MKTGRWKRWICCLILAGSGWLASGQDVAGKPFLSSFFQIRAGVSLPIMCYAKTDLSRNDFSGFARGGIHFSFDYGYRLSDKFGLTVQAFLFDNPSKKGLLLQKNPQHYRVIGLLIGPRLQTSGAHDWQLDFQAAAGIALARSPALAQSSQVLLNSHTAAAFCWSASAGLQYSIASRSFLSLRAEHTQLTPRFDQHHPEEALKGQQHIVVMNVDAGLGFRF